MKDLFSRFAFAACMFAMLFFSLQVHAAVDWDKIAGYIPDPTNPTIALIAGVVLELVLRLWKTDKPLSLLYAAAAACRGVAVIFGKLASLLDVVVQNTKQPQK